VLGRWDRVSEVAEASLESPSLSDAERAHLASLLAQAYKRRGEFDPALRESTRALQLWPVRDGPAFLRQRALHGRIALDAGRRDEALREFEAIAVANDADATNLSDAGWGFYMAGERGRAEALVKRALEVDPAYGNAYHLRGWLALGAGDLARAAFELEQAFERTPRHFGNPYQGVVGGDLAALYYAGVVRQKQGATAQARADFARLAEACRKVQQHASAADVAGRWQAESFLARMAVRQGSPAREPSRLEGDDATYFVQSARLHALEGQRERVLRELAQGLALGHGEWRHIADDPDFEALRTDAEFQRLVRPSADR
jgi:tetratricopeptide (TPR) repeat protein